MKYLIFISFLGSMLAFGQFSRSVLDANNISAAVTDGGVLFQDPLTSGPGYEIPKGSGTHAIFSSAFWFGDVDANSQLHLSGTRFGGGEEIFPGPIADSGMYTSAVYLAEYFNSIWSVLKSDIDDHIANWNQVGSYSNE